VPLREEGPPSVGPAGAVLADSVVSLGAVGSCTRTGAMRRYPVFRMVSMYVGSCESSSNVFLNLEMHRASTSSVTTVSVQTFSLNCSLVIVCSGRSARQSSTSITFGSS
jgi:hypothetical protein